MTGATGTLTRRIAAPDTAVAILRFASGALRVIAATAAAPQALPTESSPFGESGQLALHDAAIARWYVPDAPLPGQQLRPAVSTPTPPRSAPWATCASGAISPQLSQRAATRR